MILYIILICIFNKGGELPSPKLAALQKVLQSEFCTAVREVYEHVYDTVDISGSPEIRANATAKVKHHKSKCLNQICGSRCKSYNVLIRFINLYRTLLFKKQLESFTSII